MNPTANNPDDNNLYFSKNGEHWHKIGQVLGAEIYVESEMSEEDAAKLWASIEGLEIVPRDA